MEIKNAVIESTNLDAVGCDTWEKLKGEPCRVKADHSKAHAIGHFLEDKWFDPKATFEAMKAEGERETK